ncbi:MAG: right-handed parallel beta-helix repeat-containing protein, partial [Sedimentisphaerales bacterium]|nr:right-handed parallel beta-helix repeat-containing protein [Sedimentisphaerales bacterium]
MGEADPNARDILVYETVLSGDLLDDDYDDEASLVDNSWHVVTGSQTDATAVLDGFMITAGNADADDPDHAGGGLHVVGGDPTVRHCTFHGNRAGWTGGGAYCQDSSAVLTDCLFVQNTAAHGGGLFHFMARDALVTDCLFEQNQSIYEGGGLSLDGGQAEVSACTFQENTVSWNGGAIFVHPANEGSHVVTQCEFIANGALGRGVAMGGGAIADRGNGTTVSHCVFQGNRSLGDPADQSGLGGALYCNGAGTNVINCTFAGNFARAGSAMACSSYQLPGAAIVTNCILWDGADEVWIEAGSSVMASYSDIQSPGGMVEAGPGNINTDPNFAFPGYWACLHDPDVAVCADDPDAVWIIGDYHLMSETGRWEPTSQTWIADEFTSSCIDAGDPDSPWLNEPEPNGEWINLGAFGGTTQASMTWGGWTLTVSSDDHGSVLTPGEGTFVYDDVTSVAVEAVADENWCFSSWTGTAVDAGKVADPTAMATTVAIDGTYTLHANFARKQ